MTGPADRAAALLGATLRRTERLAGGDLSAVLRIVTSDGRRAIAKAGATAPAEAEMLAAIAGRGVPAPQVLAVADDLLVMEDLGRTEGAGAAWGDLGRILRRLHAPPGPDYGWHRDHAFGPVPIPNAPAGDWPAFWAERRLAPSLPHLPLPLARRVEALCARLPDLLPRHPPAALLHGDLWVGNVMARSGRVTGLIDPACYHGHAEVDLAMLALFGRPGAAFDAGYGPRAPGHAGRRPVYQLWPALVHLRLFGAGYLSMVESCLAAADRT